MTSDDDAAYETVMPIILAKSQGGPYDDAAIVAGMTCGALDQELAVAATLYATPCERYIDTALLPQVDLIAMKHGYTSIPGELDTVSGWQIIAFVRT